MSKINAVRLINLNYNNNAIRISDETFQMGGKSTLLSLRNGGGKSVLVQMMAAPFVHKQYRKTKDRPFESYFTTSKPTFIMIEWALDHGAGYCLTGMMVRRSQAIEEQSSEPLEIINFISEYPSRCEQDIYHIPVVEKGKNEVILKNYGACRQLFENYKKDRSMKFSYYDMNNAAQSRQYFDKLSEYQIYYKEWETIIRKVNLKESGLSELFSDCKDEKELVEKWFLDAIESKLNREKNRMKEFQAIIEKYISSYKDNKSKIERRDTILQFKEDMQELEERAKEYQKAEKHVKEMENRIACFRKILADMEEQEGKEQERLFGENTSCEEQLAHILYEKLSMEIYELLDKQSFHLSNRDMIGMEKDVLEQEIQDIERIVNIYSCAKQQEIVDEYTRDVKEYEQRIDVIRKADQDNEPERRRIGGYLNEYYQKRMETMEELSAEKEAAYAEILEKKRVQKQKEEEYQKTIEELIGEIAKYQAGMKHFDWKEDTFNRNYKEQYARNILGEYEAGMLVIKKEQYEKQKEELARSCNQHKRQQQESEERRRACERNIEESRLDKNRKEFELRALMEQEEDFQKQLKERQIIMRYLEMEEAQLWNTDRLLEAADHKIADSDRVRRELEKEENTLQQEWKKLTSGEILELPQDFKEMLSNLDLHPIYGMNWLDKNGNSVEENTRLVRRQPFLPYSLILTRQELRQLEAHGKEICTSFPIPIIAREDLDMALVEDETSVYKFPGISFYLWFNEKLLDEEALRILISQKEEEIRKIQEQIAHKRNEYQDYLDRKQILKRQTVTKEGLDNNRNYQTEIKEEIAGIEKAIILEGEEVQRLTEEIQGLIQTIQKEKQDIEWCERREKDFEQFCSDYEKYQQDRQEMELNNREKKRCEENKAQAISMQEAYNEKLITLESEKQELSKLTKELKDKAARYQGYEREQDYEPDMSLEDLEARYEAITTRMSFQLQDLEQQLQKAGKNLNKAKDELKKKQNKYQLVEQDWKDVSYNEKEETHQEILLEDKRKKFNVKQSLWNEEEVQLGILSGRIEEKRKGIKEQCDKEELLPKEEIQTVDFDARRNQLEYRKKEIQKSLQQVEKRLQGIGENIAAFAEYQDFILEEDVVWEEDIAQMDAKRLRDFAGIMRRDYRQNTEETKRRKEKTEAQLNLLVRKDIYQDDYYRKPLEAMLSVTQKAELVLAQLYTTVQSYDSQLAKLEVDISVIGQEKERIEGLLEDYIKEVHSNMAKIDNNSTITIRERPIKMLRLQMPDWEENEGLYRQRLDDFLSELTQKGVEIYEKNENPSEYFGTRITTKHVYDTVVGIGNIQIKLYKIEEQREYPITWAEVARNSGGEGFLSAFVILSSLLHYMRRDDTDIFADRNEGKVLVMDNPFAQTNAAHLLKPLMDMAKKTDTQLICLSGLGGDSIYSRFDNIYVLNLVSASLRGGMQYLRGEHTRGSEEEVMISSQIEVIGQQSLLF